MNSKFQPTRPDLNSFLLPWILAKEQLRRVYLLAREAESLRRGIQFLPLEVGTGNGPSDFLDLDQATVALLDPQRSEVGEHGEPSLQRLIAHVVDNYRYFIGIFGNALPKKLRNELCGGDAVRYTTPPVDLKRPDLLHRFFVLHAKTDQQLEHLLDILARSRSRVAQEVEQYPPHVRIPPRFHGRESTATVRFLQRLVYAYYNAVAYTLSGPLASTEAKRPDDPRSKISLTFDYTPASNIRIRRGNDGTAYLFIESPYYYLDAAKNASVLAHEVAHAHLNSTLFAPDRHERFDGVILSAIDDMRLFLEVHYAKTGLLAIAPRLTEGIITEAIADLLALLVAGPYYLYAFLSTVVGGEDLRHRIAPSLNRYYRLKTMARLCKEVLDVPEGISSVAHFRDDFEALTEYLEDVRRCALSPETNPAGRSRDTAEATFFLETATGVLATGLSRIMKRVRLKYAESADSPPALFLLPDRDPGTRQVRSRLEALLASAADRLDRCSNQGPNLRLPELAAPLTDQDAQEVVRRLPDLLWERSIKWHRDHAESLPQGQEGVGDSCNNACNPFSCFPAEGRLLHLAINAINDRLERPTFANKGAKSEGLDAIYPLSVVRLRHIHLATAAGSDIRVHLRTLVTAVHEATPTQHKHRTTTFLAFGPTDLIACDEFEFGHTDYKSFLNRATYPPHPIQLPAAARYYSQEFYYVQLGRDPTAAAELIGQPTTDAPWRAFLHIRLARKGSDPFSSTIRPLGTAAQDLFGQLRTLECDAGRDVMLQAILLGQGYWDFNVMIDFRNIRALTRTLRAIGENATNWIERTMFLPGVYVPEGELPTGHFLLGTATRAPDELRELPLTDGVITITGRQRGTSQPPRENDPLHLGLSGGTDSLVCVPFSTVFEHDKADQKAAERLLDRIAWLYSNKNYLSCETAMQLNDQPAKTGE